MTSATAADRRKNIENIYPLSPMQEGLLFHTVMTPEAGVYMPQIVLHLTGEVDARALEAAWRLAVRRHSVLRSGFYWEERDEPFQVVYREAALSWTLLDWSDADEAAREARLAALLAANRAEPFDLRRPPLMRVQWIGGGAGTHSLILAYHHLILDGWSAAQLVCEAFQLYLRETGLAVPLPPLPRPYTDYIAWLKRQDRRAAESFWRDALAGAEPMRFLPVTTGAAGFARREWTCPAPLAATLRRMCQGLGITTNTLLQGALGLLIANQTGSADVIFGATSSGRPATLDGATDMIGLFINTLPVRVKIEPRQTLAAWLAALQASQSLADQHAHLPLRAIQGERGALFDTLMVFESYPISTDIGGGATFKLAGVAFDEWTHFPLTLMAAADGEGLSLTARYARDALDEAAIAEQLTGLGRLLERMASHSAATLDRFVTFNPAVRPAQPRDAAPAPRTGSGYAAPSTDTEKILASAWADVLKRPEPSSGDNFFELGGHSLLAARVIGRVRRELAIELPVKSLFERPVLADLAAYIDALRAASASGPAAHHREIEF
jgi:acyl carrier protein